MVFLVETDSCPLWLCLFFVRQFQLHKKKNLGKKGSYKMAYKDITADFETIRKNGGFPMERKAIWLHD